MCTLYELQQQNDKLQQQNDKLQQQLNAALEEIALLKAQMSDMEDDFEDRLWEQYMGDDL